MDSLSVMIQQDVTAPGISIEPPLTLNCSIEDQILDASNSSSGGQIVYSWTTADGNILDGANGPNPLIDDPGLYTLTLSSLQNGCDSTQSIMIQEDITTPDLSIATPEQLDCDLTEISLDATASSSGTEFDYQWTTSNGNIIGSANILEPLIDQPGDYTLQIINSINGCDTAGIITVNQDVVPPILNIEEPDLLNCIIDSISLDASLSSTGVEFEYTWMTGNGNIVGGMNTLMPLIDEPGTYTLEILNTNNLCSRELSIEVMQDILPPVADAGTDFVIPCFEPTASLDGSSSSQGVQYEYLWSSMDGSLVAGVSSLTPDIDGPGSYSLIVINHDNGCENSDEVFISQTIPTASVSFIPPACFGDPSIISVDEVNQGISPYLYSIDGGDHFHSTPFFTNLDAGNYEVVVQDANGCEYEDLVEIAQPDSLVVITTESQATIKLGDNYQIYTQLNFPESEVASISWQHDGTLSCDDCLHPIAKPQQTTDYWVQIRSINGCEDKALIRIFVDLQDDIYVPNAFSPTNNDGTNDRFYIFARSGSVEKIKTFQIYSRWGETLFEVQDFQPNDPNFGWDGNHRGRPLNSGVFVYFFEVEFIDGRTEIFKGDVVLVR